MKNPIIGRPDRNGILNQGKGTKHGTRDRNFVSEPAMAFYFTFADV